MRIKVGYQKWVLAFILFFIIDIHIMYMNSHTFLVRDYEQTHVHIQRYRNVLYIHT